MILMYIIWRSQHESAPERHIYPLKRHKTANHFIIKIKSATFAHSDVLATLFKPTKKTEKNVIKQTLKTLGLHECVVLQSGINVHVYCVFFFIWKCALITSKVLDLYHFSFTYTCNRTFPLFITCTQLKKKIFVTLECRLRFNVWTHVTQRFCLL